MLRLADCALLLLTCVLFVSWRKSRRLRLPPGPPRFPFIGNLHQISDDYQPNTFLEWGRKYGEVVYARFLSTDVLIINSAEAARILMEKRGAKYSGRPVFTFLCDLSGFAWNFGFMPNNDHWKRHRRWFQNTFQAKRRLDDHIPIQRRETHRLLAGLASEPDAYMSHIKRLAAAIMLEIGYGHTITSIDDAHIRLVDSALAGIFCAGNPGSMLVDFLPLLKYIPAWVPGMVWKKTAVRLRPGIDTMNLKPFRECMQAMSEGTVNPSFATAIFEDAAAELPLSPKEEREMSGAAGTVYTAGTETTVSTLSGWLLAMVRCPEVYKKAQAEIDLVIGPGRLPELDDRRSLPYLECVLKEVYRWAVPVPLSIVHQLTEEDTYNGYDMPAGATIIPNVLAMSRDESMYEDPEEFIPERFLGLEPDVMERLDPRKYVFGHGRRICVGRFLGDTTLWLAMASITATFDICKMRDSAGREVTPPPDFLSGFVRRPAPFSCVFRPRSEKIAKLVAHSSQESLV